MSVFFNPHIFPSYGSLLSEYFTLTLNQSTRSTHIVMKMIVPVVNTDELPHTYTYLEQIFPDVLFTECFNEENLSFADEVKRTEIGHLFEHILLEYLYKLKIQHGGVESVFEGYTEWNWIRETRGTFHIVINSGSENIEIFPHALEKSIILINAILAHQKHDSLFLS